MPLRAPLLLLPTAMFVCGAFLLASWIWPSSVALRRMVPGCWRLGVFLLLGYAWLRWGFVRTTVLRLDETGVELRSVTGRRTMGWGELRGVGVTSWLSPTHRGGVAAGVALTAMDGRRLHVPDVFDVPREALAGMITERARTARGSGPP